MCPWHDEGETFEITVLVVVLVFQTLRWHPRYAFVLQASPLCGHSLGAFAARALLLCACLCDGIRAMPSCFTRRPCAGRHLLFFAAAKKSRQKKAANTANISSCLRAPTGSYASHGNHVTHVRCQRSCTAPHPLHMSALQHALPDIPRPPRYGCLKWVRRLFEALATHANRKAAV